jgi:CDP-diglyceride synthetase
LIRQAYAPGVGDARKTVLIALGGAIVGVLALLPIAHIDPWSWVVAPAFLAVVAVAQARALFSDGGPFRT